MVRVDSPRVAGDPETADALLPSTSPRCAAARAAAAAARGRRGHRQRAAAAAVAARPLATALALGVGIGLLAGSSWHAGRSQALRLSASSGPATRSDTNDAQQALAATTTTTPAPAPSTPDPPPPYPPAPAIPATEKGDAVHVIFTSNGSPYGNFQGRLHYASYLRARRSGGGGDESSNNNTNKSNKASKLAAFTRVLHRTSDDGLSREIPTFRADPLEPACDTWCEFPVKDRAHAVAQWLEASAAAAASAGEEGRDGGDDHDDPPTLLRAPWVLMLETDYVWRYPIAAPGDAADPLVRGQAFLFDYIDPSAPGVAPFIQEMCAGRCVPSQVLASGPAPVLLRASELRATIDDWVRLSAWIEGRKDAREALGWVREMYAWDVAVARAGVRLAASAPPASPLALQPPHDALLRSAKAGDGESPSVGPSSSEAAVVEPALFHYTWGAIFHDGHKDGPQVWRFDKRDYTSPADAQRPPTLALPPPWREGLVLQDGVNVTRALRDTLAEMVGLMNAAGAELLMTGSSSGGKAT